jgi:3-methylcrotonyl-CoA carboxylase alpha subunit
MFKKILIANRGEIACRVAATARRMGIKTVAVYSDADAGAKHVQACDEAVHVGGSAPKDSYLRWERILEAAKTTGAEAVHPGYGFLSENEDFAKACATAELVFIGPPAAAILAMGLKAESKRLMEKAGVPLVPGYHGTDQDPALLQREADRMGYPVLIKASAGGGGKGMRVVDKSEDFAAALASCQREAINSFGSDAVLIEKYVQRPRHIEIQVFGDTQGNCVYLFERDCSVQRRHQKVLEEAPAPGMTEALRAQMGAAAVAAAKAVNYVGAGTVEFIVEQTAYDQPESMKFFFMEMNTRLQVEHPVTEAITGLDLVEWQLRVASGEPLPLRQDQLRIQGHAIEARICAENPDNNFLPATGTLQVYRKPQAVSFERADMSDTGVAVRVDDGVREGDTISPFYDSMVAKLIVHGDTREQALARLDTALAQTHIVGLNTNVQFLRHVVCSSAFEQAQLDTALIQREAAVLFKQEAVGLPAAVAAVVAHTLHAEKALQGHDPFSQRDGWQSHGVAQRRFEFQWQEQPRSARLTYLHDGAVSLSLEGGTGHADAVGNSPLEGVLRFSTDGAGLWVQWGDAPRLFSQLDWQGETAHLFTPQGATRITVLDPLAHAGEAAQEGGRLTAPMPGKVVSFAVKAGDTVKAGQALAVMEAMKMEHTIHAPKNGVVAELLYAPGDQVADGAELLKLAV